jgi:magnesium-transporting ATPase (P-type)
MPVMRVRLRRSRPPPDTLASDSGRLRVHATSSVHSVGMNGLSTVEATERLAPDGPNALAEKAPAPLWRRLAGQFPSPLIYILLFALAFDLGVWIYDGAHACRSKRQPSP